MKKYLIPILTVSTSILAIVVFLSGASLVNAGASVSYLVVAGGGGGGAGYGSTFHLPGGGGGGCQCNVGGVAGAGGTGGGGGGGTEASPAAVAGTVNTGGGGGGSGGDWHAGANGGSGVVIISATIGLISSATGGVHTTSGGNDIWTFTSSGTWVPTINPVSTNGTIVNNGGTLVISTNGTIAVN
jgi:hypothetical protein